MKALYQNLCLSMQSLAFINIIGHGVLCWLFDRNRARSWRQSCLEISIQMLSVIEISASCQ
jgi:hypothetical protein